MTDARLRELERRYRESGADEDGVAWLQARLRAGEASEGRLRAAAFLGDRASRAVLGADAPTPPMGFRNTIVALCELGPEVAMRATIASAWRVLPLLDAVLRPSDPEHPRPIIEAGELCVVSPALDQAGRLIQVARDCDLAARRPGAVQLERSLEAAWQACRAPAELMTDGSRPWWGPENARFAIHEEVVAQQRDPAPFTAVDSSLLGGAGQRVLQAVAEELVPWALGLSDPVRERVAKRGRVDLIPEGFEPG